MNDAYTIGITLALENGVSAGVAAIRRELGELTGAADASIGGLSRLGAHWGATMTTLSQAAHSSELTRIAEAGHRLLPPLPTVAVPSSSQRKPGAGVEPVPDSAVTDAVSKPEPLTVPRLLAGSSVPPPTSIAQPAIADARPALAGAPSAPTAPPPAAIAQPALANAPSAPASAPSAPTALPPLPAGLVAMPAGFAPPAAMPNAFAPTRAEATMPVGAAPASPPPGAVLPATPTAPILSRDASITDSAAAPTSPMPPAAFSRDPSMRAFGPSDLAAFARSLTPLPAGQRLGEMHPPQLQPDALATFERSSMPAPQAVLPQRTERAAPIRPRSRAPVAAPYPPNESGDRPRGLGADSAVRIANAAARGGAAPVAIPNSSAAPVVPTPGAEQRAPASPEQQQATGPDLGHIFLDGHLVGRWMRDHLAQKAARAPSGGTGFDMRLGAVWPGAPILS